MELNLYGDPLQSCSSPGMASTGYSRNGRCTTTLGDKGRHHVCIDLTSTTGGSFCGVTGQREWCSNRYPCHGNSDHDCSIEKWCVCEWAFAQYVEDVGCENIGSVKCDATHENVLTHYQSRMEEPHVQKAMSCLESKCPLDRLLL